MPREALLGELAQLSQRELALTLRPLLPKEREQVIALVRAASQKDEALPPFEALAGLSPWLLKAIERGESKSGRSGPPMTPAARTALAGALRRLAQSGQPKAHAEDKARPALARLLPWRPLLKRAV